MIFGRTIWIWIWWGILVLGAIGFFPAFFWGRRTHWKNLDELLRATGTVVVSIGMILLLQYDVMRLGYLLLFVALMLFIGAFVVGRNQE